jgi:hypothetical protein
MLVNALYKVLSSFSSLRLETMVNALWQVTSPSISRLVTASVYKPPDKLMHRHFLQC